jgi:hypothetical protein
MGIKCRRQTLFGFKAIRDFVRRYRLIAGTGHSGHGWDFPQALREMDMIMVDQGKLKLAEHEKRIQVLLAFAAAFERENPDIDTLEIQPRMWAIAIFMYCHGRMQGEKGFANASAAAAWYGVTHKLSNTELNWSTDWALRQMLKN